MWPDLENKVTIFLQKWPLQAWLQKWCFKNTTKGIKCLGYFCKIFFVLNFQKSPNQVTHNAGKISCVVIFLHFTKREISMEWNMLTLGAQNTSFNGYWKFSPFLSILFLSQTLLKMGHCRPLFLFMSSFRYSWHYSWYR